jgi:hypothetical protein
LGQSSISSSLIFDSLTPGGQAAGGSYNFATFVHDICGNLLPGGTELKLSVQTDYQPLYGVRLPKTYFGLTPGDQYLEPTRHLLTDVSGGNAKVNFNSIDHPSESLGYPAQGYIEVPACSNQCTGLVSVAGVACDSFAGQIIYDVSQPKLDQHGASTHTMIIPIGYPAIATCTCNAGTYLNGGVCACPEGTSWDSGTSTCKVN